MLTEFYDVNLSQQSLSNIKIQIQALIEVNLKLSKNNKNTDGFIRNQYFIWKREKMQTPQMFRTPHF